MNEQTSVSVSQKQENNKLKNEGETQQTTYNQYFNPPHQEEVQQQQQQQQQQQRPHRSRRRSSIAAGPTLDVTPENFSIERSSAYGEFTSTTHRITRRRNSLTHGSSNMADVEARFRQSFASMMEYQGQSINIQKLKDKLGFERRGSLLSTSNRSSVISGRSSSVIGSVVDTTTKSGGGGGGDDDILSQDVTGSGEQSMRSISMPLTEVRQPAQKECKKKNTLGRDRIIESLVNFSCHTPCAVLEDLIKHELRLWEDHHEPDSRLPAHRNDEDDNDDESSRGSVSTLSSDENGGVTTPRQSESTTVQGKSVSIESTFDGSNERSLGSHSSDTTPRQFESTSVQGNSDSNESTFDGSNERSLGCRSSESFEKKMLSEKPSLPRSRKRQCALLFVDIHGFTKLSTMLDVESLSKVINSYFEMIVEEVLSHGGDILKFAGDAFFAEWRVEEDEDSAIRGPEDLMQLNASLSSSQDFFYPSSPSNGVPAVSFCVWKAAKCATSIVNKFSDFQVPMANDSSFKAEKNSLPRDAMLNVHCGVGTGELVGLHVGDYREGDGEEEPNVAEDGQDDNEVELRREFLFLGNVIDQVSIAANDASDGEVMASPEALLALARCCDIPVEMATSTEPQKIASRHATFISLGLEQECKVPPKTKENRNPPYESLRRNCTHLHKTALERLHLQLALYVHPVVRGDELAISQSFAQSTNAERHLAAAELRSVYTMFIKALVSPKITNDPNIDGSLFKALSSIMHVTSRELDRYSGQLRQFIVDDKGVVLIATFGLRGSTFPNMITNNALPATFDISKALSGELGVETRIGATFGQVYCGVVGGIQRHEFAVLGAAVNLAARLMESSMNSGILVDNAVKLQADSRFEFLSKKPIQAKGYAKPVVIFEPLHALSTRKRGNAWDIKFTGRSEERSEILGCASEILDDPATAQSFVINLIGESGIGKTALGTTVINEIKLQCLNKKKKVMNLRSSSTESEQRIPLCAFRKVFLAAIRELCLQDGSIRSSEEKTDQDNQVGTKAYSYDDHEAERGDLKPVALLRSESCTRYRSRRERMFTAGSRSNLFSSPGLQSKTIRASPKWGPNKRSAQVNTNFSSLPRPISSPRWGTTSPTSGGRDVSTPVTTYLNKLYWACEGIGYQREYADLVANQFLQLQSPHPVTHINGQVPAVSELVEFVAQSFMKITESADLTVVFVDDFQWIDSMTWKVIRALGQSGQNMLLVCAMRSHDKQAMRRMATSVNFRMEITLGPLNPFEIRKLACAVLGCAESAMDDLLCTEIYNKTAGLPVCVIETLEGIKRNKSFYVDKGGMVRIDDLALVADRGKGSSALFESLLNRFDALDVRVRKILQTCAVLGNSFAFSDLIRVHPELPVKEIETSLNTATSEMILVEVWDEEEDQDSKSASSSFGTSIEFSNTLAGVTIVGDRYFEFSHDMWMSNVLNTMLKERKIELHRRIAETMEKEQVYILKRNDIGRLLTLFDHWKLCGSFRKAAPLALIIGTRLSEWDLTSQSLELYEDAFGMCFDSVRPVNDGCRRLDEDWVQVTSNPEVLNLILRLHLRMGDCQLSEGNFRKGIKVLEDAHKIVTSVSGECTLRLAVLSNLCCAKLEMGDFDDDTLFEQGPLIRSFVEAAAAQDHPVHLSRALSMEAAYFAQHGELNKALRDLRLLEQVYKIQKHSWRMVDLYGKDYAAECFSQGILWYFLSGEKEEASKQADLVIQKHLPFQDQQDVDSIMALVLPAVLVLKFVGRAAEALYIIKRCVINAHYDLAPYATYWVEMFNPLVYLLEIVKQEDEDEYDIVTLDEIQGWVMHEANGYFPPHHLRLAHCILGEICFRLAKLKQTDDPMRQPLRHKARSFLTPIARDALSEPFLSYTALYFLKAL